MAYQMKAVQPFDWHGAPVAAGDTITVEETDAWYIEHLIQGGRVCNVDHNLGDTGSSVQPMRSTDADTPPAGKSRSK